MSKFYARNGGIRLSGMPFEHRIGDEPLKDILIIDNVGDKIYFSIKVYARDSDHAKRILMGVLRNVYAGITITDSPYSLFADFMHGYNLFDFVCNASETVGGFFNVVGSGVLCYYGGRG